jgi:hypothetical protein
LKVFYDSTVLLSGVYYHTSCLALTQLMLIAQNFEDYRDDVIFTDCIDKMETKFKKYWGEVPSLFYLAMCLDPRMKIDMTFFQVYTIANILKIPPPTPPNQQVIVTYESINNELTTMCKIYESKFGSTNTNTVVGSSSSSTSVPSRYISQRLHKRGKQKVSTSSSELQKYLEINFTDF